MLRERKLCPVLGGWGSLDPFGFQKPFDKPFLVRIFLTVLSDLSCVHMPDIRLFPWCATANRRYEAAGVVFACEVVDRGFMKWRFSGLQYLPHIGVKTGFA